VPGVTAPGKVEDYLADPMGWVQRDVQEIIKKNPHLAKPSPQSQE
jgi:hypothetical protein